MRQTLVSSIASPLAQYIEIALATLLDLIRDTRRRRQSVSCRSCREAEDRASVRRGVSSLEIGILEDVDIHQPSAVLDEVEHKTREETAVEIADVDFKAGKAIGDCVFRPRDDGITGNQIGGIRGQIARKDLVGGERSQLCRHGLQPLGNTVVSAGGTALPPCATSALAVRAATFFALRFGLFSFACRTMAYPVSKNSVCNAVRCRPCQDARGLRLVSLRSPHHGIDAPRDGRVGAAADDVRLLQELDQLHSSVVLPMGDRQRVLIGVPHVRRHAHVVIGVSRFTRVSRKDGFGVLSGSLASSREPAERRAHELLHPTAVGAEEIDQGLDVAQLGMDEMCRLGIGQLEQVRPLALRRIAETCSPYSWRKAASSSQPLPS